MSQWVECSEAALRRSRFTVKLCLTVSVTLVHGNLEMRITPYYLDLGSWDGLGMHLGRDTSTIMCRGPWHEWIMDSNVKQGWKTMKQPRRHFLPWSDGDFKQLRMPMVVNAWQTSSSLILPKNSLMEKLHFSKREHRCFKLPMPILNPYSTPLRNQEKLHLPSVRILSNRKHSLLLRQCRVTRLLHALMQE